MNLEAQVFRTRGRAAKPVEATVVRALEPNDLILLGEEKGSQAPALKRLSERHHALARTLAAGTGESEAAIICGYSLSRVSILKDDPAFKELLAFYRDDVNRQYADFHEELAGLSKDATAELRVRLEEDMEAEEKKISLGQLIELTKLGADRTGFGPQSNTTNLNVNVDLADRLQRARERVAARSTGLIGQGEGDA